MIDCREEAESSFRIALIPTDSAGQVEAPRPARLTTDSRGVEYVSRGKFQRTSNGRFR
jgi:hypothetical protein